MWIISRYFLTTHYSHHLLQDDTSQVGGWLAPKLNGPRVLSLWANYPTFTFFFLCSRGQTKLRPFLVSLRTPNCGSVETL